jgi:hypothetical protein
MRNLPEFQNEAAAADARHPVPDRSPRAEAAPGEPLAAGYLDRLCALLPKDVSPMRRREIREELAAHLEALIEAHVELGSDREEAVRMALRQFGDPKRLAREWRKASPSSPPSWALALVSVQFLAVLVWFGVMSLEAFPLSPAQMLLAGPLAPLATGLLWGRRWRQRQTGYGPLALAALMGAGAALLTPGSFGMDGVPFGPLYESAARAMLWALTACGAAGLTACVEMARERKAKPA